jgi:hypothetical protein
MTILKWRQTELVIGILIYVALSHAQTANVQHVVQNTLDKCNSSYASEWDTCSKTTPPSGLPSINISLQVAAIIETNLQPTLFPLLIHFHSILGPDWPIHIYTTPSCIAGFSASASMRRLLSAGGIKLFSLPEIHPFQ